MTRVVLGLLMFAAACGNHGAAKDAPVTPPKDGSPPDTPPVPACATPITGTNITVRPLESLSDAIMLVTSPPGDSRRFLVQRDGYVRIVEADALLPGTFLDVNARIATGGEQGLLGLAFHPQYAQNGQFFIYYTTNNANVVARCARSAGDANMADATCPVILSVPDFASNHNGGMMEFGKDGFLYIGTGDGGGGGDPQRTSQNTNSLLGKMLRIDVDTRAPGKEYGIPADNPYAGGGGAPEVYLTGLRNPWRWSFDKMTGDLWIGDVGQRQIEELTVLRAGQQLGKNLGWSVYEGSSCCDTQGDNCTQTGQQYPCNTPNLTMPQVERTHGEGWVSIIAGEVYRGTCYPDLVGWHFYTDYLSQAEGLWRARLMANDMLEVVQVAGVTLPNFVASIHADARGDLYLTTAPPAGGGRVYRIEVTP